MKVSHRIAVSLTMLTLAAAAIAEPSQNSTQQIDQALHEVLLPGTTVVAGDSADDNDFYIASEEDAVKIIDRQKQVKEEMAARQVAEKHEEEYRKVQLQPKTLASLNMDMRKLLNKYAAFDSKATIVEGDEAITVAKSNEKISTQKFNPVIVASAKKQTIPEEKAATDYPLEPVMSAKPKKHAPVAKQAVLVADASSTSRHIGFKAIANKKMTGKEFKSKKWLVEKKQKTSMRLASSKAGSGRSLARKTQSIHFASANRHTRSARLAVKSVSHRSAAKKTMLVQAKTRKQLAAGVIRPYMPAKSISRKRMLAYKAQSRKSYPASSKFVVKTVSYDRNRRLKIAAQAKAKRLTANTPNKNRSRYEFKVIHLYR